MNPPTMEKNGLETSNVSAQNPNAEYPTVQSPSKGFNGKQTAAIKNAKNKTTLMDLQTTPKRR